MCEATSRSSLLFCATAGRWTGFIATMTVAACASPPTVAEDRGGLDVVIGIDSDLYQPGDPVHLSIENRGPQSVFADTSCGFLVEGERSPGYWSGSYGSGVCISHGPPVIVEIVEVAPGETVRATSHAGGYETSWRVHFCLFDRSGQPLLGAPTHSPVFQVQGGPRPDQLARRSIFATDTLEFMRRRMERHDICEARMADSLVIH